MTALFSSSDTFLLSDALLGSHSRHHRNVANEPSLTRTSENVLHRKPSFREARIPEARFPGISLLGSSVYKGNGTALSGDCPRIYERRGKDSNLRGPQRVFGRVCGSARLGAALPSLPLRRDLYPPAPGVPLPVGPASSGECSQRGGTASARARGSRVSYRVGFGVLDRYRRGRKGGSGARVSGLSSTRGGFGLQ